MSPLKEFWRSLLDTEGASEAGSSDLNSPVAPAAGEFSKDASLLSSPKSRRSFIKLMGASFAFAGLTGCKGLRKPTRTIRPYAQQPESLTPGRSNYYATSMNVGDDVVGLLVESHEGRPTKIEGNPSHSLSLGATNKFHQASVLDLYDPDRLQHVTQKNSISTIGNFKSWIHDVLASNRSGKGLSILIESSTSPTFYRQISQIKKRYPASTIHKYTPVNRDSLYEGLSAASGQSIVSGHAFDKADIIVSFDSDFLNGEPGNVVSSKEFSTRRDPDSSTSLNRLYSIESTFTVTGSTADHRIAVSSGHVEGALWIIANAIIKKLPSSQVSSSIKSLVKEGAHKYQSLISDDIVSAIASDLIANKGRSILIAGDRQPASVHSLIYWLNDVLKNAGSTVMYRPRPLRDHSIVTDSHMDSITNLLKRIHKKQVKTLVILGGNPAFNTPGNLQFAAQLSTIENTVHVTSHANDTTALCQWGVPRHHYLESWSDTKGLDGSVSIVQPLIEPLYEGLSDISALSILLNRKRSDYALVRQTWRFLSPGTAFTSSWKRWLNTGVIHGATPANTSDVSQVAAIRGAVHRSVKRAKYYSNFIEATFVPDDSVYDGRWINNAWMQECPDPITKLTWDNAARVSPALAKQYHLKMGDIIEIDINGKKLQLPVYLMPGQAKQSITLPMGYGQKVVGRIGKGSGFNVFPIQNSDTPYRVEKVSITKTDKTYSLATTQEHGDMEGRPLYRQSTVTEYLKNDKVFEDASHVPLKSLWKEKVYDKGYQWGMTVDLSKCTGCNACVVSCQSENNIPVVGKKEVMNGREMHWIRLDRYFVGADTHSPELVTQPVACVHCENAPCEQVCPVAATTHDDEGLNGMTYNRCIGTRYCANNCPYKVRRFNFFDWNQRSVQSEKKERLHFFDHPREPAKTIQMQHNPDVTVRMRGVMEKCTYCTQRISEARSKTANEGRQITDSDLKTACQQVCPSNAIVFGDILNKDSEVSQKRSSSRSYAMLAELNIKPRTLYLGAVRNPNPTLSLDHNTEKSAHEHHS
ncbi:4Fe-4S dicluster domain-containing protein [bacterium]|jgi:Fe-S-cluster-containing dehydrogenase component|nr:4Fe-4S dicluster domain-containing protein [bacterium]